MRGGDANTAIGLNAYAGSGNPWGISRLIYAEMLQGFVPAFPDTSKEAEEPFFLWEMVERMWEFES